MFVEAGQIARVVVLKRQLAGPAGPQRMQHDLRAEFPLQLLDGPFCVGIERGGRRGCLCFGATRGEAFDLANRHSAAGNLAGEIEAVFGLGDREQRAPVAG